MKHHIPWLSLSSPTPVLQLRHPSRSMSRRSLCFSRVRLLIPMGGLLLTDSVLCGQTEPAAVRSEQAAVARSAVPPADPAEAKWAGLQQANESARRAPATERAARLAVADQAKAFYGEHAGHPNAARARSMEILALVDVAESGDRTVADRLQAAVQALRENPALAQAERARGVAAFEFTQAMRSASTREERMAVAETVGRALMAEFPGEPQGPQALVAVMNAAPTAEAIRLARELAASAAPEAFRRLAELLLARQDLPGRRLADLLGREGEQAMAKLPAGEPVIVYSWATWGPGSIELGRMIQARRFAAVGICLDEEVETAQQQAHAAGLGGELLYDPAGSSGALAARFAFSAPGQIYLVDAAGIVRDVRGGEQLEAKLAEHGFRTRPIPAPEPFDPSRR